MSEYRSVNFSDLCRLCAATQGEYSVFLKCSINQPIDSYKGNPVGDFPTAVASFEVRFQISDPPFPISLSLCTNNHS